MAINYDPALFTDSAVSEETRTTNETIEKLLEGAPDPWAIPPAEVRAMRARGEGPFPLPEMLERAATLTIDGPAGALGVRIIEPAEGPARGLYLHFHGGGWMLGGADQQDLYLERIANGTGLVCASIAYRLAPEHPYPAAPDDCEAAALWALREGLSRFGVEALYLGGESAGAHLAAVTLLRLRDRHGLTPFAGANLVFGAYDLTLTPSARNYGREKLILSLRDIEHFVERFVPDAERRQDPDVSPLYARLDDLPPALFSVGTDDALLDDTLFMHARWAAAGNKAELAVYPGGAHGFIAFPGDLGRSAIEHMINFLNDV